jgi:hypothetical protein
MALRRTQIRQARRCGRVSQPWPRPRPQFSPLISGNLRAQDAILAGENPDMRNAVKSLYYQSESHADLADRFVEKLKGRKKKAAKAPARTAPAWGRR